jgi:glutaminyl-tRNA synthetase
MRTRFPPEPNGQLHIGHLKAIIANFEGLTGSAIGINDTDSIVCNLRFDDTNPDMEKEEYKESIIRDLSWLGYQPKFVSCTSDFFSKLNDFMLRLLDNGEAYLDFSTTEEIHEQRKTGEPSPCRDHEFGGILSPKACVRIKIDPAHTTTCMRDPVIYRYKSDPAEPGWFPTYDFSHPIVDYLEGITHSYCTREFYIRRELYYWLIAKYQAVMLSSVSSVSSESAVPTVYEFNRLDIEGVKLSKRFFLKEIEQGRATGFDDPSLFTIAGLRNKGHSAEALLHFCRNYVSYVAGDGGTVPMHKFEHAVREHYDLTACRRFGIPVNQALKVKVLGGRGSTTRPQPDRDIVIDEDILINRCDFKHTANKKYKRLKSNNKVWLKYYQLVSYVDADDTENPTCLTVQTCEPDGKSYSAIQWLSSSDIIKISGWYCEGDILDFEGQIIQFERCGYFRVRDNELIEVISLRSSYVD